MSLGSNAKAVSLAVSNRQGLMQMSYTKAPCSTALIAVLSVDPVSAIKITSAFPVKLFNKESLFINNYNEKKKLNNKKYNKFCT